MTGHFVTHATFSLERSYRASTARVFAAWADPAAKARWFAGPDSEHQLDFRPADDGTRLVLLLGHRPRCANRVRVHDVRGGERLDRVHYYGGIQPR